MKSIAFLTAICISLVTINGQILERRGIAPNGAIFAMEKKGDVLYAGGTFKKVGYLTGGAALIMNDDTTPNLDFPHINGDVLAIVPDGEGGWYIGGEFDQAGSFIRFNVAHVMSDMTIDTSFNPVINGSVEALCLIDSLLFIGGHFTLIDTLSTPYLAAYNLRSNSPELSIPHPNKPVYDFGVYHEEIFVAGAFSQIGDSTFRGLACINLLNYSLQTFPTIISGQTNSLLISGDSLYAGGTFPGGVISVDLVSRNKTDWQPKVTGFGLRVNDMAKQDTIVYFVGNFTKVNGINRKNVAAVSIAGNLLEVNPSPDDEVFGVLLPDKTTILIGGDFLKVDNHSISHIAKLNENGRVDSTFNLKPDWSAHVFKLYEGKLLIGGEFEMLNGHDRENIFAMNIKTGQLLDWSPNTGFFTITTLKVDEIRDVVYLTGWDSNTSEHIKAFNGTSGEKLEGWNLVCNNYVNSVDQDHESGIVYIGGEFTTINGEDRKRLAAIDTSGNLLPFAGKTDGTVYFVKVSEEHDRLYIAGLFNSVNDTLRYKVAALNFNGQIESWNPRPAHKLLGPQYAQVTSILPLNDKVFIGGRFDSIGGDERLHLAAVDPITAQILPWNANIIGISEFRGTIHLIEDFQNGIIVKGSDITYAGGRDMIHWTILGKQSGNVIQTIYPYGFGTVQRKGNFLFEQTINVIETDSNKVFTGGMFEILNQKYHPYFAQLTFASMNYSPTDRIEKYSPDEGGNTGDVTIEIFGTGLTAGTEVILRKSGLDDIPAAVGSTFVHDGNRMIATFDLRNSIPGTRDIVIVIPGDTTIILGDAFYVKEGIGALPWAEIIAPSSVATTGIGNQFFLTYGNKGDVDAHGVPVWTAFSPNIEVLDMGFEVLSMLDENHEYFDSIPEYVMIDSLTGLPYPAKIYSFIIPKLPAGSSFVIPVNVKGTQQGTFYTRAWVGQSLFGSPLKYWVGECQDALISKAIGFVPFGGCASGTADLLISPFVDYAWDPDFGSGSYALNYLELTLATTLDCGGDALTGGTLGPVVELTKEALNAKSFIDIAIKCLQTEEKGDVTGEFVNSFDPNDKTGPSGNGKNGWINSPVKAPYLIRFENDSSATAPAKIVMVRDTLDKNVFDISTIQHRGFTIADKFYEIIQTGKKTVTIVDLRPRLPYHVEVKTELDEVSGEVLWTFTTLDTINMEPVTHPLEGFLPPDKDGISGRASLLFDVELFSGLPTGSQINNKAAIFFDFNEAIITNKWGLTIDMDIPESHIIQTADTQYTEELKLQWKGSDIGSGIMYYDVLFRINGGEWNYVAFHTKDTFMIFKGVHDNEYEFFSIACDSAFNMEEVAINPDAKTFFSAKNQNNTWIKEPEAFSLDIRPNPVERILLIEVHGETKFLELVISDFAGRTIQVKSFRNPVNQVITFDMSNLSKGVYVIHWDANGREGRKILLKQ